MGVVTFAGKRYHFARNISDSEKIQVCDGNYNLTGTAWGRHQFCDWLKEKYRIDTTGRSFHESVSSFFRIYGKENLDERRPLKGLPGEDVQKAIDVLVKTFDCYKDIQNFNDTLVEQKKKLSAFMEAWLYRFVPDLVGGRTRYEGNLSKIRSLETELDNLATEIMEIHGSEDIEKVRLKSQLDAERLRLETDIQTKHCRLALFDMSLELGLYPAETNLSALQEYFPKVNVRKLYEVERYHRKLAKILDDQFSVKRSSCRWFAAESRNSVLSGACRRSSLTVIPNSREESTDSSCRTTLLDLRGDARNKADDTLKSAITSILADIEHDVNAKMKEFNDSLYADARKAPRLHYNNYNSYTFETPDDTGTGTNHNGMVLYDLAVLCPTSRTILLSRRA